MLTNVERLMLFALGEFCNQTSKKLSDKPLELLVSKAEFIMIAKKTQMTEKKQRALYKNFEALESKKLIAYKSKNLTLTIKGQKELEKVNLEITPYLNIKEFLKSEDPLKYAKKAQTRLSNK